MRVKAMVTVAMIAGLLACGKASHVTPLRQQKGVTLTTERPAARLPIDLAILQNPLPILEVPVTQVINKQLTPFAIFVYLAWTESKPGSETQRKLLIGNFGVFPPDHPGRYTLRASSAFDELRERGVNLRESHLELLFVMRKVRETEAWTPIEVTISPVRWLPEDQPRGN